MRLALPTSLLGLAACVACGGATELEGVEVVDSGGAESCLVRDEQNADDFVSRCIGLVDARAVDVLFVIDDGPEAGALQTRLAEAMGDFSTMIAALDPQPDLRIAFTSSRDANPMCTGEGGSGRLLLSSCTDRPEAFIDAAGTDRYAELCAQRCELDGIDTVPTSLDAGGPARSRPWIEIYGDATNLAPGTSIDDALGCVSLLGVAACPFPAPASATEYAFLRSAQDEEQPEVGFFRTYGIPIVVWVTSGVECSLGPAGIAAFDPAGSRALWTDPEVVTPGVCWNAGVECAAPDDTGKMSCEPRDVDAEGVSTAPDDAVLQPADEIIDFLREIAEYRALYVPGRDLRVLAITGVSADASDGTTTAFTAEDEQTAARYGVQPTCVLEGGDALLPPVRHSVLAAAAPPYDVLQTELLSACTDDFAPALARVAEAIASSTRVMCMPACVADTDPEAPGWQVECSVEVEVPALGGGVEDFSLPPCDVGTSGDASIPAGEPACFATRTGAALREQCADEGYNLEFDVLWAGHKPQGATFLPRCELSDDKAVDCPDL